MKLRSLAIATALVVSSTLAVSSVGAASAAPGQHDVRRAAAPPAGDGSSHLYAQAQAGDGAEDINDRGTVQWTTDYEDEAVAYSGGTTTVDASANAVQDDHVTADDIHIGGTSTGSPGQSGGSATVRNEVTFTFTVPTTGRWEITLDGTNTGQSDSSCVTGLHVSFTGMGDHAIACNGALVLVQQTMTLTAGTPYTFSGGHAESAIDGSATYAMEATLQAPVKNKTAPKITGTPKVGKKLTATKGTWSGSPTKYAYQWFRGSSKIAGATKSTYTLVAKDKGKKIKVTVTASKPGSKASASSKPTGVVK